MGNHHTAWFPRAERLDAWLHTNHDKAFYNRRVDVPVESAAAESIKRVLREQIQEADVTVCLISQSACDDDWIAWELETSKSGSIRKGLVGIFLHEHDPHPVLFDTFSQSLSALKDYESISFTLLNFQWAILCETGFKPELNHDAQTGDQLDDEQATYAFSAAAGGVVADTGTGDRWRVRGETIKVLRNVANDESRIDTKQAIVDRANRLLAAYIREVIGSEPNAMQWAFPEK